LADIDEFEVKVKAIVSEMSEAMPEIGTNGEWERVDLEEELQRTKDEAASVHRELQIKESCF
jgi:hypothetical protein